MSIPGYPDKRHGSIIESTSVTGQPAQAVVNPDGSSIGSGGGGGGGNVNLNEVGGAPYGLGQTTSAGSMPVVLSNDGENQVQITDVHSVESQNMAPGTPNSSGNAMLTAPTSLTAAFSVAAVQGGTVYDVGNYASVKVHILTQYTGTSPTITFQCSDDGTNWVSQQLSNSGVSTGTQATNTTVAGVVYSGNLFGRYFRLNFTGAYSSGNATGTIVFSTIAMGMGGVTVGGTVTVNTSSTNANLSITTSSSTVTTATQIAFASLIPITVHGTYAGVSFGITVSDDNGTTFYNVPIQDGISLNWLPAGSTISPPNNSSRVYWVPLIPNSSVTLVKVTASAYTSGTATVHVGGSTQPLPAWMTMNQIMDAAGNARGANVNALNALDTDTTSINGSAVATVASGVQAVGIDDGTNIANVVAGDSGFNGVAVASATKTYSFTTSASGAQTILANTPTEGFSWIEIVYTSVGSGLVLTGQFSPTNAGSYITPSGLWGTSGAISPGNLGAVINTIYYAPIRGSYFQLAISALTSGTFTGTVTLRATAPPVLQSYSSQNGTWTVGSNSATGSAVPSGAFYMGASGASGNLAGLVNLQTLGDAGSGAGTLGSGPLVFNGTNYDRTRSATAASNTTGTGLLGAGQMVFDGTNWQKQKADTTGTPTVNNQMYPLSTALNTYSIHLTSNATTTPTASTAYISSITISNEVGGTTSTVTIQDKQGTPLKLVNGLATTALTTAPTVVNFQTPVKMVSGIDIITAGAVAATVDIWVNYYQ